MPPVHFEKKDPPSEDTEVEFITALDDAAIRQNCFQMSAAFQPGGEFPEVLADAMALYDWVMGNDDVSIEEAAEPASAPTEESCGPQRH